MQFPRNHRQNPPNHYAGQIIAVGDQIPRIELKSTNMGNR